MTQVLETASHHLRGLGAALQAIAFLLWFSFGLFSVRLNQNTELSSTEDVWFAVTAKYTHLTLMIVHVCLRPAALRGKYSRCCEVATTSI
jgi:hypothetical protein